MIIEQIECIKEFVEKRDPEKNLHYQIYYKHTGFVGGLPTGIRLSCYLYGINKTGNIIKTEMRLQVTDKSEELADYYTETQNYLDALKNWVDTNMPKLEEEAKKLGATPGSYYYLLDKFISQN